MKMKTKVKAKNVVKPKVESFAEYVRAVYKLGPDADVQDMIDRAATGPKSSRGPTLNTDPEGWLSERNKDRLSCGLGRVTMEEAIFGKGSADRTVSTAAAEEQGPKAKRPGVIQKIIQVLKAASAGKPVTKTDLLKALVREFPERSEKAMKATIGSQVPSALKSEKGIVVKSNANGWWLD